MKIIFAGGGTAGHVEPALAIARLWRNKHPNDLIEFIGTAKGLENQLVPAASFKLNQIPKVVMPRKISPSLISAPFAFFKALTASRQIINGSDLLIGFGGYVSAPAYLAAKHRRNVDLPQPFLPNRPYLPPLFNSITVSSTNT